MAVCTVQYELQELFLLFVHFAGSELDCGDKDGHTPLHLAAAHQHYSTVQVLLQLGADISKATRYNYITAAVTVCLLLKLHTISLLLFSDLV